MMRFSAWKLVAVSFAIVLLVAVLPLQAQISGVPSVTDGDTLRFGSQRIRLHGIDAPESKQRCRAGGKTWACGAAATRALRERIVGRPVECADRDRDRYGRIVAVCRVAGEDVNAWMVAQGLGGGLGNRPHRGFHSLDAAFSGLALPLFRPPEPVLAPGHWPAAHLKDDVSTIAVSVRLYGHRRKRLHECPTAVETRSR